MNQYFLFLDEAQKGPFTLSQLRSMWNSGTITAQTLYWQEGFTEWIPLSTMLDELEPASPPAPAAVPQPYPLYSNPSPVTGSQPKTENTLWTGHPSHWNYFWSWFFGILLLAAYGLGLLIIIGIYIARAQRVYTVTSRKVVTQTGLLIKSTNEVRIKDIRSINVTKSGIAGFMGIGNVEFSSAAADRAEIVFGGIALADGIRDMVRKLQDDV